MANTVINENQTLSKNQISELVSKHSNELKNFDTVPKVFNDLVDAAPLFGYSTDFDKAYSVIDEPESDTIDRILYMLERGRAERIKMRDLKDLDGVLKTSSPSDFLKFTKETKTILSGYLIKNLGLNYGESDWVKIPNDIFISDTVPMPDFVFTMTIYDTGYTQVLNEFIVRFVYSNGQLIIVVGNTDQGDLVNAFKPSN